MKKLLLALAFPIHSLKDNHMKTKLPSIFLFALLAVSYSCKKDDPFDSTYFRDIPFAEDAIIPSDMAVDMGTGVKWRSGNLGTRDADENGDYYAWGEVKPYYLLNSAEAPAGTVKWAESYHSGYNWNSYYKFTTDNGKTFSKYNGQDNATLLPEDDAAHMVLGGKWRMPTLTDWQQLIQNSTVMPVTLRGRKGFKITSIKYPDHYIFLPFTGYRNQQDMENLNVSGAFWSSTLTGSDGMSMDAAQYGYVGEYGFMVTAAMRNVGCTIRPVYDTKKPVLSGGDLSFADDLAVDKSYINGTIADGYSFFSEFWEKGGDYFDGDIGLYDESGTGFLMHPSGNILNKKIDLVTPSVKDLKISVKIWDSHIERTIDATWNGRWLFNESAISKNDGQGTLYYYNSSPFKAGTLKIDLNKDKSMPITMSAILYDGTKIAVRLNAHRSCG